MLDEGEVVGEPRGGGAPAGAGRAAGGFEGAHGVVGAERPGQAAALTGEVGERVEPRGEGGRAPEPGRGAARGGPGPVLVLRAEAGRQLVEGVDEAAPLAAAVRAAGGAVVAAAGPLQERPAGRGRVGAAGARDPCDAGVRGERRRAAGPAERVQVEPVLSESVYEPLAPDPGVTDGVRVATLREQSDPHECTPDLP